MFRQMMFGCAVAIASATAWGYDGTLDMRLSLDRETAYLQADRDGDSVRGTMTFADFPSIHLTRTENRWAGRVGGQYVSNVSLREKGNGKYELRFTALPAGFFRFTIKVKPVGNLIAVNGITPSGEMLSGGVRKDGREVNVSGERWSLAVSQRSEGSYTGGVTLLSGPRGRNFQSGFADLRAAGSLSPAELAVQDPVLFTLLYILPFAR